MSGHSPSDEVTLKQAKRILFDIDPGWAFAYMFTKQPVRFLFHKLEPDKDINQGYMLVFGIGIAMLVHTNQKHIFYKAFKSEAEIYNNES